MKKYAFIKIRSNHAIIDQIIKILAHTFPDYQLDVIDIKDILRNKIFYVFINLFHVIKIYGFSTIFESKSVIYNRFFGTPYMYHVISRLLDSHIAKGYAFTIQDCSLFNGKQRDIPNFVYTDHTVLANKNYPSYDEKRDLLAESWINLERNIYSEASMVFTRSEAIRNSVINDYSCDPSNVECVYFAPFITTRSGVVNAEKYKRKKILFVGIEWERKGGPQLVEAFKQVLEVIPDASLVVVGCAPTILLPNVEVIGLVDKEYLPLYYENASVFCLPTQREPFGIVFIEAMSYSLPVIGTNIGALPEFIHDGINGYKVNTGDVDRLSALLIELLSDPIKCEQLGKMGYGIYHEKFTLEGVSSLLNHHISRFIV
ncbi:MAG: glycosyltransferase family 4 protein [Gammaproteobacteria bacterium]|nr:glycosyltransferase family 4 protein [Gammaproteobacteria bacterium]